MKNNKIRFAVFGTNFISDRFLKASERIPEFQLTAVSGSTIEKARAFAARYGIDVYFDDARQLLDAKVADAVYLAVPNSLHFSLTKLFLEHGIPVLCEKPLASNSREVSMLLDASRQNKTLLMEGIVPLYTPNFHVIQESLGKLGPIRRAVFNFSKYSSRYDSYRQGIVLNAFKRELSNGSIMDIGIYLLYQAVALFGMPSALYARATLLQSGVDGIGTVVLSYPDKECVLMHSKIVDSALENEIQGEDGCLLIKSFNSPISITFIPRKGEPVNLTTPQYEEAMFYEIREFIDCMASEKYESAIVPHDLIQSVHTLMDEIRSQTGVVFPSDV